MNVFHFTNKWTTLISITNLYCKWCCVTKIICNMSPIVLWGKGEYIFNISITPISLTVTYDKVMKTKKGFRYIQNVYIYVCVCACVLYKREVYRLLVIVVTVFIYIGQHMSGPDISSGWTFAMNPRVRGSGTPKIETISVFKSSALSKQHSVVRRKWMLLPAHS